MHWKITSLVRQPTVHYTPYNNNDFNTSKLFLLVWCTSTETDQKDHIRLTWNKKSCVLLSLFILHKIIQFDSFGVQSWTKFYTFRLWSAWVWFGVLVFAGICKCFLNTHLQKALSARTTSPGFKCLKIASMPQNYDVNFLVFSETDHFQFWNIWECLY